MTENNIKARIIIRKATSAEWSATTATPLKQGEFALNTTTGELKIATQDNQKFQDAKALATKELVVGSVQYLGTVGTEAELKAKTPNSAGDFCRVSSTNFTLSAASSITGAAVTTHAGDLLLCESISPSVKWSVIHGELDKNTWTPNSASADGYVSKGNGHANKVWKTDANGNPGWRDDANTVYTLPLATDSVRGGIKIGYNANGAHLPVQLSSEKAFVTLTKNAINSAGFSESYLTWGGQNFEGSYGPIDAAMVPDLGADRFAFLPANLWTIEYSRDGGSTWIDYGATEAQKLQLTSTGANGLRIGKASKTEKATTKYQIRFTLTTNNTIYSALNKFVIYVSTDGSNKNWCTITARTKENLDANNNIWVTYSNKTSVSGWSGWNIINTSSITTWGNNKNQYGQLRFTFGCDENVTGITDSYIGMQIVKIKAFGGVGWNTPSNMAKYGTIYSYDYNQKTIFPAAVSATSFIENGTALSSKYLGISAKAADSLKLDGKNASDYATKSWVTDQGYTKNIGTVTGVKINGTSKSPTSGVVDLGTVLTAHQAVTNKAATLAWNTTSTIATIGSTNITVKLPANPNTDTKNTAGTTNKAATKMFLVGATEQTANPQTYSNINVYIGTDNCLYSNGTKVLTAHQSLAGYATKTWVSDSYVPLSMLGDAAAWDVTETVTNATNVLPSSVAVKNFVEGQGYIKNVSAAAGSDIDTVGTPSVTVTNSGTTSTLTFHKLKGATGDTGPQGPQGPQGPRGETGTTPTITASATVSNTVGTPSVTVINSGTTTEPSFTFAFQNLKGAKGDPGVNATTTAVATTTANGLMSKEDKTKLNGINMSNYLPLSGGTLTGNLEGQYLTGSWLRTTADTHLSSKASKFAVIQDGWIYSRTASEMISDLGALTAHQAIKINGTAITPGTLNLKAGSNVTFNNSNGTLTINSSASGTDTKNTAGSSNSTSKLYLVGATSQSSAGATTYSHADVYATNGFLYSTNFTASGTIESNSYYCKGQTQWLEFNGAQYSGFEIYADDNSRILVDATLTIDANTDFTITPTVKDKKVVVSDDTNAYKIKKLTQAQYNALQTKDASTIYLIVG